MKYVIYVFIYFFLMGCGGSSSTVEPEKVVDTDKNNTEEKFITELKDFSNWNLSEDIVPKFTLSTGSSIADFSDLIYPNHPRLYFRDSDYEYLKSKISLNEWSVLESTITSRIKTNDDFTMIVDKLTNLYADTEYTQLLTFYAYISDDKFYKDTAIKWAVDVLAKDKIIDDSSQDTVIRRRIARLAEVYDWLYADLNEEQKRVIRDALKKNIDVYMSWDYVVHPDFIQSHSRWGHGVVEQGLLAMYGDFDENFTKSYADSMLSKIRELLREYEDAEGYIASDGGWHLGWMYNYFYADYSFNYQVWTTATKETFLNDWMGGFMDWFLYAMKPGGRLPVMGDASMNDIHLGYYTALYQVKFKKDAYAKWYLNEIEKTSFKYNNYMMKFLFSENQDTISKSPDSLPLSRYFKNVGVVIARDSWDDDNTLLIFKSSPFYNAGHHHRDENSFTIDYKTSLAVDSGFYDLADSKHYKNYYIRTIAHNAITVFNPNQKMYYNVHYNEGVPLEDKLIPNDGGQIYQLEDAVTKEDILGKNRLTGVTKYNYLDTYTYMQGDATKTYDPLTVSLAKRDIVYLKDSGYEHPVVIILDKVESVNSSFQKRYLLHMDSDVKPTITSNITEVITKVDTANSAKMVNITLYPTDATLKVIGDNDRSSIKAYPYYDETETNVDTAPNMESGAVSTIIANGAKTGNWRLEVAPKIGNKYDLMLNAIFVGDENMQMPDIGLVDSSSSLGVVLKNRVVIFSKDKSDSSTSLEYSLPKDGEFKHTVITGYKTGDNINIKVNGIIKDSLIVKDGGCIDFSINTKASDTITIAK